jgi:hypothetical protein
MNVKTVTPCNDPMMYASLRAEPNFRYVFLNVQLLPFFGHCSLPSISQCARQKAREGHGQSIKWSEENDPGTSLSL